MNIKFRSRGQYDSIKGALLLVISLIIGPATYTALVQAIADGDVMKYLMALGLMMVGIVLILLYRILMVDEKEKEATAEEDKPNPPKESEPIATPQA